MLILPFIRFYVCVFYDKFQILKRALFQDPCRDVSHLASTYSALAILKIIGYDLANIDCKALLLSLKKLQQPDGR
jgi:prenyltransferase beta subunit